MEVAIFSMLVRTRFHANLQSKRLEFDDSVSVGLVWLGTIHPHPWSEMPCHPMRFTQEQLEKLFDAADSDKAPLFSSFSHGFAVSPKVAPFIAVF